MLGGFELLPLNERQRVYNLSDPKLEIYTMFARGSADTHSKNIYRKTLTGGAVLRPVG